MYDFITVGGATRDISFFTDQGVILDNKKDILRQKILALNRVQKLRLINSIIHMAAVQLMRRSVLAILA